ncbi:DNA-binding TFAR19-related protein [Rhizodiscina lignyota]|uniref:DNA-binding TFAR19-related protein n=1 Tax=Rhizodiscina lignyota TaxID=1504668 RepID=A0A9P4MGQ7_9PEZI|nr:DNA-binding TFAR19-related protein [Rhizodiscina lignyota]
MADPDLEEIRKARLAQLRGNSTQSPSSPDSSQADQQASREAEARASILSQIISPEAADRLNRIKLVKESRATDVENRLIALARSGQLREKVTEEQLKQLLGAMSEQEGGGDGAGGAGGGKIQVVRKSGWEDDDDDLLDL